MSAIRTFAKAFSGGEVTPEFFGRIDDGKYQTGLATCRNFILLPHGPAANRPGFEFVREVKDSSKKTRLIPFTFSTVQTFAIELGAGYIRFHTLGATLLAGSPPAWSGATTYALGDLASSGGVNYYSTVAGNLNHAPPNASFWYALPSNGVYEIPNGYAEADLMDIHYVQSADVLTLVHPNYPPAELRRLGATQWTLININFGAPIGTPTSVVATSNGAGTGYTYGYVVTAIAADGISESVASSPQATCVNNLNAAGGANTITFNTVAGATGYNVYKNQGGRFGFIGTVAGGNFVDDNIAPDLSRTPPNYSVTFSTTGNYPGAVTYFEQRRCFAGTTKQPQNIWMTRSGTESDLSSSIPTRDDDGIAFKVAAREANTIRHLVPLNNLVPLTSSAEWRVTSVNSDALTPSTIAVRPQSYIGANNAQPVLVNNNLLYAAARGGHMRELAYNWQASGYITGDLSLRAPHLFDGLDIVDMTYVKSPYPIVWAVSSNGQLLGLTYVPEQQVGGWHRHDTDGVFESVTAVAEGSEDALYAVIRRTINGSSKRYVERLHSRVFATPSNAFFVDAGLTYNGAPTTSISGLSHLEGKTVSILADGAVHPLRVVTAGAITLEQAASVVNIGLPYNADLKTLPIAVEVMGYAQGRKKNVNRIWLRVYQSSGIFAGPSFDKLKEAKQRTTEPYGTPPALKTAEIPIDVTPSWSDGGELCVRQSDPLPLTIVALSMDVEVAG